MPWFDVDRQGLAAILERRGKSFAVFELIQNAWDSGTSRVEVRLEPVPGQPYARLEVEDWGEGFTDLSHAFTMFARSRRADQPELRGRFGLGEKIVLACCRSAEIVSTCGTVKFDNERCRSSRKREWGTLFTAEIRMTREELEEACRAVHRLLPPVPTSFNNTVLERPEPMVRFETKLPTEIADQEGILRRTMRNATVEVYQTPDGRGELLELGVPIVETENTYRLNVLQKCPMNMDRDNVSPAFLRTIQAALLNHVHQHLDPESASSTWVQEAAGDALAQPEAVRSVITKRFGERAVIGTPGDPIANARAEASGFTVVPGGALSSDLWANVKKHDVMLPSGKVFPTPTPEAVAAEQEAREGKCPLCGK